MAPTVKPRPGLSGLFPADRFVKQYASARSARSCSDHRDHELFRLTHSAANVIGRGTEDQREWGFGAVCLVPIRLAIMMIASVAPRSDRMSE